MNSLLQREIDALSVKYGRHQIALELNVLRRSLRWARRAQYEWARDTYKQQTAVLTQLARERFPREHGRECLRCGKRRPMANQDFCIGCDDFFTEETCGWAPNYYAVKAHIEREQAPHSRSGWHQKKGPSPTFRGYSL